MTVGARGAVRPPGERPGAMGWVLPLSLFLGTQLVALVAFTAAGHGHYTDVVARWDGVFYTRIARDGYPAVPAVSSTTGTTDATWAFYPLYPMLLRLVASLTPLSVASAAPLVSLTVGGAGVVALFRMVERHVDRPTAIAALVLVCTWMSAPVLQMAYTESLALLLLAWAFDLLLRRRYPLLLPALVLLSLSRPLLIPFAVVVAVHARGLWSAGAPVADRWRAVGVLALCPALAALWPVIAAIVSGAPMTYFAAMASFQEPGKSRSWAALTVHSGLIGWGLAAGVVGVLLWIGIRGIPAGCPTELRAWAVVYPLYILTGSYPSGSLIRYLLLNFPAAFLCSPLAGRGRGALLALAVTGLVGAALGVLWIHRFVGSTMGPIP